MGIRFRFWSPKKRPAQKALTVEQMAAIRMKQRPERQCAVCTFSYYSDMKIAACPRCGLDPYPVPIVQAPKQYQSMISHQLVCYGNV